MTCRTASASTVWASGRGRLASHRCWRCWAGLPVLDYWGMADSYRRGANPPFMEARGGPRGKPWPGGEMAILDEDGPLVRAGERGELCRKARPNPPSPLGYWNRP